jgi:hypothetical protein
MVSREERHGTGRGARILTLPYPVGLIVDLRDQSSHSNEELYPSDPDRPVIDERDHRQSHPGRVTPEPLTRPIRSYVLVRTERSVPPGHPSGLSGLWEVVRWDVLAGGHRDLCLEMGGEEVERGG